MKEKYILFLKYAIFKGENSTMLFRRKFEEIEKSGKMFWGYGGFDLQPIKHAKPFLEKAKKEGKDVAVLFCQTKTFVKEDYVRGQFISQDNINFERVPNGITLHGSKYCFIMTNLKENKFELNLCNYYYNNKNLADIIVGYKSKSFGVYKQSNFDCKNVTITHTAILQDCVFAK